MSEHRVKIDWSRGSRDFSYESYSREHAWRFPNTVTITASAMEEYRGDPDLINPEDAFVAAAASCHMLTFLAIAARKRLVVDSYEDHASGFMENNQDGKLAITRIVLRPRVTFGGPGAPPASDIERLHAKAHDHCFIATSVRTSIAVEPA